MWILKVVRCYAVVMAAVVFSLGAATNGSIVENGGFEDPDIAFEADANAAGGSGDISGLPSWVFDETSGDDIRHFDGPFTGIAPLDGQYVGFTYFGSPDGGSISQSLATVIGQTYSVSFYVNDAVLAGPNSYSLVAAVDNAANDSLTATPSVDQVWEQFSFDFVASSTSTTLSFTSQLDVGDGGSADVLLDNVAVNGVVPAPGAFVAGLLGLGCVARRRRVA